MTELKRKRNRYDEEFKREAVRVLLESGKPVTQIADLLGIEQSNLNKWSKRYGTDIDNNFSEIKTNELQIAEIVKIKKEISSIKSTIDIMRGIILKALGDKYNIS